MSIYHRESLFSKEDFELTISTPSIQPVTLSPEQEAAKQAILNWYFSPHSPQIFKLFGLAGTGKTTLMYEVARCLQQEHQIRLSLAAFTGKAASVLRKKTGFTARTIHGLIYDYRGKYKNNRGVEVMAFGLKEQDQSELNAVDLVILDEGSMVSKQVASDIRTWGVKMLVLGDPGQLPPVNGEVFFQTDPDFELTQIHRQAADNPIIQAAYNARAGLPIQSSPCGRVVVHQVANPTPEYLGWFDQILCGQNRVRVYLNRQVRGHLFGNEDLPVQEKDKLVNLLNNHDLKIYNGEQFICTEVIGLREKINKDGKPDQTVNLSFRDMVDAQRTINDQPCETRTFYCVQPNIDMDDPRLKLDYGYAMTVHKSQGSEWDKVLVMDDGIARTGKNPTYHRQWLYTAITRAKEVLHLVQF